MIPNWPSELPRPLRDSWQRSLQESRQKRGTDAGPPSYRRRFSSVARLVNMAVIVDHNGRSVFDSFYETDTSWGSKPFYMPDPSTDGWAMLDDDGLPLLTEDDEPILLSAQWLCMFGDQVPTESAAGNRFRISFSVAVMP